MSEMVAKINHIKELEAKWDRHATEIEKASALPEFTLRIQTDKK